MEKASILGAILTLRKETDFERPVSFEAACDTTLILEGDRVVASRDDSRVCLLLRALMTYLSGLC